MVRANTKEEFIQKVKEIVGQGFNIRCTFVPEITLDGELLQGVYGIYVFERLPQQGLFLDPYVEIRYDAENQVWVPSKELPVDSNFFDSQFNFFKEFLDLGNDSPIV